jgi:hypothetical protein
VLSSSTDVKELIPEFYMPATDFLVNRQQLPLGVRQTGERGGGWAAVRRASAVAG